VLGSWHVPSFVVVRRGALKSSSDALSGELPVAGLDYSLRDAWPSPRVDWTCLSLPECLPSLPHLSLSLGSCAL
jgi:hypothetical protein